MPIITLKKQNQIEIDSGEWEGGKAKSITFLVTDSCQLNCDYCYFQDKSQKNVLDFDIARKTINYALEERIEFPEKAVIFDFIGGEPFIEINLIDKICDHFKKNAYLKNHPWFNAYRFSFSTNGLLYHSANVQNFIQKNFSHLDISISIDGTKRKHDMHRKFADGRGSYDEVIRNVPLWLKQFPNASTKATVSSEDIPFVRESVLHLFDLNIKFVNINVVFENVWKEGDDLLFEKQLRLLADDIIDRKLYRNHACSFFTRGIGRPNTNNGNWCGTGKMLAVDYTGKFYPCIRFTPNSLINKSARTIGDCFNGINKNLQRAFLALTMSSQSSKQCIECDVATGCSWCQGFNYDDADSDTIYQRAIRLCKMHKARVRANNYFWQRYDKETVKKI